MHQKDDRWAAIAGFGTNGVQALSDAIAKSRQDFLDSIRPANDVLAELMQQSQRELSDMFTSWQPALTTFAEHQAETIAAQSRQLVRAAMPQNLRDIEIAQLSELETVIAADGIPMAHVPRGEIVQLLLNAPDFAARRGVLVEHADDIAADCLAVLADPLHDPEDEKLRVLARKATHALQAGHPEAAQALAVLVSEQFISTHVDDDYKTAVTSVKSAVSDDRWLIGLCNYWFPHLIIATLYTRWRPEWNAPVPEQLSRHVTVHQVAADDHLDLGNAVIAVMQSTGLIAAGRWLEILATTRRLP